MFLLFLLVYLVRFKLADSLYFMIENGGWNSNWNRGGGRGRGGWNSRGKLIIIIFVLHLLLLYDLAAATLSIYF